jgi:hypothetical protein
MHSGSHAASTCAARWPRRLARHTNPAAHMLALIVVRDLLDGDLRLAARRRAPAAEVLALILFLLAAVLIVLILVLLAAVLLLVALRGRGGGEAGRGAAKRCQRAAGVGRGERGAREEAGTKWMEAGANRRRGQQRAQVKARGEATVQLRSCSVVWAAIPFTSSCCSAPISGHQTHLAHQHGVHGVHVVVILWGQQEGSEVKRVLGRCTPLLGTACGSCRRRLSLASLSPAPSRPLCPSPPPRPRPPPCRGHPRPPRAGAHSTYGSRGEARGRAR